MQYGYGDEGSNYKEPVVMPPPRLIFDGKRMRKPIQRKTVDYNSTMIKYVEERRAHTDFEYPSLFPNTDYVKDLVPPQVLNPITSITAKFVHTSLNKLRCPVNCVTWTPEGRRLITGSSSGEFTLWNGLTFNFETILQAHDTAVRAMVWSHNDNWMVSGDHGGYIKYWQSNMNNVKAFQAHKEAVRDISFCPTDVKFASCSDDVTVKIWDFARCKEEQVLTGHGWDVKAVDWHPQKSLVVSGSKDNLIKLWDAKSGRNINTLHGHKNTVLQAKWNQNGNWLLSASRDQLVKLFELRMMKELQTFRGHNKEVTAVAWHPFHEDFFVSGGFDGALIYWRVGTDDPQAEVAAHESSVWDLGWHPVGHILCSGSNDHTTKFWCRNRPGDMTKDKVAEMETDDNMDNRSTRSEPQPPSLPSAPPGINVAPGLNVPNRVHPAPVDYRIPPHRPNTNIPPPNMPNARSNMPPPIPPNFRVPPPNFPPPGWLPPPGHHGPIPFPPPNMNMPPPGFPMPPGHHGPIPYPPPNMNMPPPGFPPIPMPYPPPKGVPPPNYPPPNYQQYQQQRQ